MRLTGRRGQSSGSPWRVGSRSLADKLTTARGKGGTPSQQQASKHERARRHATRGKLMNATHGACK
jgi:hypothetical protein